MTTEILRNIMYRTEEAGPGSREDRLANVGLVVLDEVIPPTCLHVLCNGSGSAGDCWSRNGRLASLDDSLDEV